MIRLRLLFTILVLFWLTGCGSTLQANLTAANTPEEVVAAAPSLPPSPTTNAAAKSDEEPPATATTAVGATIQPTVEPDSTTELPASSTDEGQTGLAPGALGIALVTSAAALLPDDWQLKPCYEAAGPFCWYYREELSGSAGLDIKAVADYYPVGDPLRHAAALLPADDSPFTSGQETAALEALNSYAAAQLQSWHEYQTEIDPDCRGSQQAVQPGEMGPLPAVIYGYACQDANGETADQVLWAAAMDGQQIYLFQSVVSLPSQADYERHAAVFEQFVANMPLDDPAIKALAPLPPVVSYEPAVGEFPHEAQWSVDVEWPESPAAVPVLRRPAQNGPLTAEEAQAVAARFGFDNGLAVETHSGLSTQESAELGFYVAFDDTRSLALIAQPFYYNDVANWYKGPDLPFAAARPLAEQFLQENRWLDFDYETAESDQGEGVLFLPRINGLRFPVPAFGVDVAGNGGVSSMNIYALDDLSQSGNYPILTAEMAWSAARRLGPGTSYRVVPPLEPLPAVFPIEYSNIPAAGEVGDFYTNIWAYQPLDGEEPPIILSSDFHRVTGDPAMLQELATQTDYVLHLWGTVRETSPKLLELELTRWEPVPDAGGVPMFFGKIKLDGGQAYLVDEANRTSYWLPNAPVNLEEGAEAAVSGMPVTVEDTEQLVWQRISIYPPQPDMVITATAVPIQAVSITGVKLIYSSLPSHMTGLNENLFIPTWEFSGSADNGAQLTIWVTALFPEFQAAPNA